MTDFSKKTDDQIDHWIFNHERGHATDKPLYRELVEERARRGESRSNLKVERSISLLKQAAIEQRCVSYGDIAKASGVDWSKARHRMNGSGGHLDNLLDICFTQLLPMLPALCVNQNGVATGELEPAALTGFCNGARRLGFPVTDEIEFHHRARDQCWAWGASQLKP